MASSISPYRLLEDSTSSPKSEEVYSWQDLSGEILVKANAIGVMSETIPILCGD